MPCFISVSLAPRGLVSEIPLITIPKVREAVVEGKDRKFGRVALHGEGLDRFCQSLLVRWQYCLAPPQGSSRLLHGLNYQDFEAL